MARVVTAVADNDECLFSPPAILQMMQSLADRIVQSGSSACRDSCQRGLQVLWVVGKGFAFHQFNRNVVIEIYDEHLILGIARMREVGYSYNDVWQFGTHTPAVINNEPDSNRRVAVFKYSRILKLAVFVDVKVFQLET